VRAATFEPAHPGAGWRFSGPNSSRQITRPSAGGSSYNDKIRNFLASNLRIRRQLERLGALKRDPKLAQDLTQPLKTDRLYHPTIDQLFT
jgi:hypothetical protein